MVEKLSLDEKVLRDNKNYYSAQLNRPTIGFNNKLLELNPAGAGFVSSQISLVKEAVEQFFSVYATFRTTVGSNGLFPVEKGPEKNKVRNEFLEALSLYAGASEGLYHLVNLGEEPVKFFSEGKAGLVDLANDYKSNCDKLISIYSKVIKDRASNQKELVGLTKDFFKWVVEETTTETRKERYGELSVLSKRVHINVNGITINGFDTNLSGEIKDYSFEHTLNDIVGNKAMIKALQYSVEDVLMFDPATKSNTNKKKFDGFQQTFNFWGRPGTGKSVTIDAVMNYALEYAAENNKTLIIENITNDFKSEFYSKSANNLKKKLEQPSKGDASYIFILDDVDMMFYSRSKNDENHQDTDNLEVLMHFLQGVGSVNFGNYIVIATTNRPLQNDSALARRLKDCELEVTGPETSKDYADLFHIKMKKNIAKGFVAVDDWTEIGDLCVNYGLSGSSIADISKNIIAYIKDVPRPRGLAGMSPDEQEKALDAVYSQRKVYSQDILRLIEHDRMNEEQKRIAESNADVEKLVDYKLKELMAEKIVADRLNASERLKKNRN